MEDDKKLALTMQYFTPEEFQSLYKRSLEKKKISYLPYLVPTREIFSKSAKISANPTIKKAKKEHSWESLSTYDLLVEIDALFKRYSDVKKIKSISAELMKRADFFEASMEFLEIKNVTYDELYYWYPGLDVSDTLSLILCRYPILDFAAKYKRFVGERILLANKGHLKVLESKIPPSLLAEIKIMVADIGRFESGNVICHNFWCDEGCEENIVVDNERYRYFPAYCYSFCDIEIDGNAHRVTIKKIRQLIAKDETVKDYWEKLGVNWDEDPEIIGLNKKWLS